jgi:hypothetical protein
MKEIPNHSNSYLANFLKKRALVLTFLTLLFSTGGAAAATFTWLDSFMGRSPTSFLAQDPDINEIVLVGGQASALGSHTLFDGAISATYTNTISGFSINSDGNTGYFNAVRFLKVSGLAAGETLAAEFSFLPTGHITGEYEQWTPDLASGAWNPPPFWTSDPTTVQLSNGTYLISLAMANGATSVAFNVVPEPGSAMLCLTAFGLCLRRKRCS